MPTLCEMPTMSSIPSIPTSGANVGQSNSQSAGIRHDGAVRKHQKPKRGRVLPPLAMRLRALREAHGGGQAEIAEAVGISRSYLAGLEVGKEQPGRETLAALATFYGISVDSLYQLLPSAGLAAAGDFVQRPSDRALLRFWHDLSPDELRLASRMLMRMFNAPPEILEDDDAA